MAMDAAPMLKRKGAEALEELWLDEDPASSFPVSSRATKIRRLDAEVMPPVVPTAGVPPQPQPVARFGVEEVPMCGDVAPAANEERAIVVYKPAEVARSLLLGPLWPGVPLHVSPEWIHGLKNTMLQEASNHRALFQELARDESSNLAMVPWAPSHSQATSTASATATEMMDAPPPAYDDLLGGYGRTAEAREAPEEKRKPEPAVASAGFDDLIPGCQRNFIG